jgi:hypothetical protein
MVTNVGYLIIGALLLWVTGVEILPAYRRAWAPRRVLQLVVASYATWALTAVASVAGVLPWWVPLATTALPLSFLVIGDRLIDVAGGPVDSEHLRRAYYEVVDLARRPNLSEDEVRHVVGLTKRLDRYRSETTSEFISLVQDQLTDWAESTVAPDEQLRSNRVLVLGNRLWGGARKEPDTGKDKRRRR